jgi:hypothetical protein
MSNRLAADIRNWRIAFEESARAIEGLNIEARGSNQAAQGSTHRKIDLRSLLPWVLSQLPIAKVSSRVGQMARTLQITPTYTEALSDLGPIGAKRGHSFCFRQGSLRANFAALSDQSPIYESVLIDRCSPRRSGGLKEGCIGRRHARCKHRRRASRIIRRSAGVEGEQQHMAEAAWRKTAHSYILWQHRWASRRRRVTIGDYRRDD